MTPRVITALVLAIAATAWCAPNASAALHLSEIASFSQPVYVTAPPADPHRVFVVERQGRIMEVLDGVKQTTPFLDITAGVRAVNGEQGLLSMAFAPDYATSGRFYVYYTAPRAGDSTGSVITVREFIGSGNTADPATGRTVFTVDHPINGNHNGGQVQFGPDGLLYAGTGDGGSGNDPPGNAQNLGSNLGKLVRVAPLSAAPPAIYAYGLRNPFRFSFDRQTGDLTIGDVGQGAREEVDFTPTGTPAGINYGWVCWEGTVRNGTRCDPPAPVFPVLEKDHSGDGFCAIIGGYVVRDPALGSLAGRYVYGDNCASAIRSAVLASPAATGDSATGLTVPGLTSFGEDSCGHVYAASGGGPVYRIDGDSFAPCPEPVPPPGPAPGPGPDPGPGPGPAPGGAPPDTTSPKLQLAAWPRQRALLLRGFRVHFRCNELCGAVATGKMRIVGSNRVHGLARETRIVVPGRRTTVILRASKAGLKALRAAFLQHRRVTASLSVTARDAAGNKSVGKRTLRAVNY